MTKMTKYLKVTGSEAQIRSLTQMAKMRRFEAVETLDHPDTETLNWLEENVDDIEILRDLGRGEIIKITYCHPKSGCQVEVSSNSLRTAVDKARAGE